MSLCGLQRGRCLARCALGVTLSIALAALFSGCGRTPPEAFWEPTKDDSAAIKSVIEANKAYLRTGLAELAMVFCDTALPGTTATIYRKELRGNPFKQRFRLNQLEHVFFTDSYELKYTFIGNLDSTRQETTCTVTLAETIPGTLRIHAWEMTDSLRESLFFPSPGETLRLPFYDTVMTTADTLIEKRIDGASIDGCVLKKDGGQWSLWKLGGGSRFYAPGPDDAPYILNFHINSKDRVDTVNLRPDTLHYGIQRFFSFADADSQLLAFRQNDWMKASNVSSNAYDAYDYVYFNGRRYEFKDTIKLDSVAPGDYRLYLEHIPVQVLWEVKGKYVATVWGVPIRVLGGAQ